MHARIGFTCMSIFHNTDKEYLTHVNRLDLNRECDRVVGKLDKEGLFSRAKKVKPQSSIKTSVCRITYTLFLKERFSLNPDIELKSSILKFCFSIDELLNGEEEVVSKELSNNIESIDVRASHTTDELMLLIRIRKEDNLKELKRFVGVLKDRENTINSSYMMIGKNTSTLKHLTGSTVLRESLCDIGVELTPISRFDKNPWQAENFYRRLEQLFARSFNEDVAWDLNCSFGIKSLLLSRFGYKVFTWTNDDTSIEDVRKNFNVNKQLVYAPPFYGSISEIRPIMPQWCHSPSLILLELDNLNFSKDLINLISASLHSNDTSRLIITSSSSDSLMQYIKELHAFGHELRQIELHEICPEGEELRWIGVVV